MYTQKCSIKIIYRLCGGQGNTSIFFSSNQLFTTLEVCLESLSCCKINSSNTISIADCLKFLAKIC
ncbi:hypothetical protein A0H76_2105 [Hepatospora eriocheir]|uniref:Uncharacterized protein n=1 Tax=Hepatospora eriocheir TaxID=1081669 RepID=A0A1X0QG17_9MICR|nr:hypothetical protein A0H76_2105 [Hepatospora eriocheir]